MTAYVYNAPEGDSEVVTIFDVKFFSGVPVEVTDPFAIGKLATNKYFSLVAPKPEPVKPAKVDKKAKYSFVDEVDGEDIG